MKEATFLPIIFLLISASVQAETLPDWFISLRDAVYEQQLSANEISPMYQEASSRARLSLSGAPLYLMLSRCEYMMGRTLQYEDRFREAAARYEEGIAFAQRSLDLHESSEAWQMLAENISQSCVVRSTAYAMANGLRVERYARNALAINSRNAAAQIMIAARWVYAPAPFNNINRGRDMMKAILDSSDPEKDDLFNVYSAVGYAYLQQKRAAEARPWLIKSLEIYPSNKYVTELLENSTSGR